MTDTRFRLASVRDARCRRVLVCGSSIGLRVQDRFPSVAPSSVYLHNFRRSARLACVCVSAGAHSCGRR